MNTEFVTNARPLMGMYERALRELRQNIRPVYGYDAPVMNEGGIYHGIWLESGPHQSCVLGEYDPRVALHAHLAFIKNADPEGFIPPCVGPNDVKTGHIQTVVPFARTALYAVKRLGLKELLEPAYRAAAKYDAWLDKYRNRQGTGLVEAACHWDTGHDNSPRHDGQPDFFPG
ncbi:MAG: alpha-L-rhamnosidase, partial [Clostridia bacterium]|nr:alpha-L-rhamnosidase [Clostridia bacterium]